MAGRHLLLDLVDPRMRGASTGPRKVGPVFRQRRMAFTVGDEARKDGPDQVHLGLRLGPAVRRRRFAVRVVEVDAVRNVARLHAVDGRDVLGHVAVHDAESVVRRRRTEGPRRALRVARTGPRVRRRQCPVVAHVRIEAERGEGTDLVEEVLRALRMGQIGVVLLPVAVEVVGGARLVVDPVEVRGGPIRQRISTAPKDIQHFKK